MKNVFHFLLFALLCSFVQASVITFENLTVGAEYYVGDTLVSDGVQIPGKEFFWYPSGSTTTGHVTVQTDGKAGGTGNELWLNNINLDFDFSFAPFAGISFQYGEYGGNVNLEINGVQYNENGFAALNGTMMNGVMVTVVEGVDGKGAIFATGLVDTFSIGGQELAIDNVIACVPEPATLALVALGSLSLIRKRR
ncbi:MAG: PEP-CTERM sorting domain-containing protein [Planctomycetota bacterium]